MKKKGFEKVYQSKMANISIKVLILNTLMCDSRKTEKVMSMK